MIAKILLSRRGHPNKSLKDDVFWLQALCRFPLKLSQMKCCRKLVCQSCQFFEKFREAVRETGNGEITKRLR